MLLSRPLTSYPEGQWYVWAWRFSDPVILDIIKDHYRLQLKAVEDDGSLTTGEREQARYEILEQQQATVDWYCWDYCDASRWFPTRKEAQQYYQHCVANLDYAKTAILSPSEFEQAMANTEQDHRVFFLKKYLLTMRDTDPPEFRIRIDTLN
jgi:hypothetical protein